MKFKRTEFKKASNYTLIISPRRRAAAERFVQREIDSVPLFPEMARFQTAEDRLSHIETVNRKWHQDWRNHRAKEWREARAKLATLSSSERLGLLRYWNSAKVMLPRDPSYLASLVRQVKKGQSAWKKLRILKQFKLVAEGRLPKSVFQSIRAWENWS